MDPAACATRTGNRGGAVIELLVIFLTGFCIGGLLATLAGCLYLRMNSPRGSYRPRQPEQPLAADLIRYSRWRSEQIERALRDEPIRLDPGRVQRGNGSGGPTTPKPDIIPKPQSPSPRIIPDDTP